MPSFYEKIFLLVLKSINSTWFIVQHYTFAHLVGFGYFSHSVATERNIIYFASICLISLSPRAYIPDCKPEEGQPVTQSDHWSVHAHWLV